MFDFDFERVVGWWVSKTNFSTPNFEVTYLVEGQTLTENEIIQQKNDPTYLLLAPYCQDSILQIFLNIKKFSFQFFSFKIYSSTVAIQGLSRGLEFRGMRNLKASNINTMIDNSFSKFAKWFSIVLPTIRENLTVPSFKRDFQTICSKFFEFLTLFIGLPNWDVSIFHLQLKITFSAYLLLKKSSARFC